ncbi:hypothetical protein QQF64_020400 [Cirrhinus molitorella]|uniref:ribonuclease H n=1 Tax=Cirrhinus molitorella TaxID=172907 RepID=A0ABR3L928_9TELE
MPYSDSLFLQNSTKRSHNITGGPFAAELQLKEPAAEFAEEVERLVTLPYTGVELDLHDQIATYFFLKGLCNQKVAYEVLNKDPHSHRINTGAAGPVRQPVRRTPLGFQEEEERHLNAMLEAGVITPSASEWASPMVLAHKKDRGICWCVDYWHLKSLTTKDAYSLPKIEECLDVLGGPCVFSTLELQSGYWQIVVDEMDRAKMAFITCYGLYEYTHMPFGLWNAPSTFQRERREL